jgi:hypothetical protein
MSETPNHEYNVPDKGEQDWHQPLNANFQALEVDIEIRDEGGPTEGNNDYEPTDGAKYLDTSTGLVYLADGSTWSQAFDLSGGGGGGGISSLTGGEGIEPDTIDDGETVSVAWEDASGLNSNGIANNFLVANDLDELGNISDFGGADDLDSAGSVNQLSGSVAGGQTLTDIAGDNLSIDSQGNLNASTSGTNLTGGEGINPGTITDGETLSVAWSDAASLDSSGDIDNFGSAASLDAAGLINDFSSAASLDLNGTVDAGRYLTTSSGGQVDFAGPAEWSNAGSTGTNTVSGGAATVAGGENNEALSFDDTVGGGENNKADGGPATIAGGLDNSATAQHAVVSGGANNDSLSLGSFIGGGARNEVNGNYATIGGGNNNLITADYATIAGGNPSDFSNEDATRNAVYDAYGTVGGGGNNQAGSDDGTANAEYATVPGGRNNTASGAYSTAIGRNATASEDGSFVVGDSTSTEITPSSSDEAVFQMPVNTSATFGFTDNSIFLSAFENDDGNDLFTVSVPGQYFPFDMLRVVENGNVTVAGNLAFSEGLQSDTGTNVVINSDNELAADSSSARHKTDIQPHSTSDGVLDLELRSFQYEETGSEDVGFIAEEVEEHVPEIVTYDDEDRPFGVKYDRVGAHLVPEVRDNRDRLADVESKHDAVDDRVADLKAELDAKDARIDDQQDRIEKLEAENERLTAENDALRERVAAIEDKLGIDADQQAVADD